MSAFIYHRKRTKLLRASLRRHASSNCTYCNTELRPASLAYRPTRDHWIPKSRFLLFRMIGLTKLVNPDDVANIVICCRTCNNDKGPLDGDEYVAWKEGRASRLDIARRRKKATLPLIGTLEEHT